MYARYTTWFRVVGPEVVTDPRNMHSSCLKLWPQITFAGAGASTLPTCLTSRGHDDI